MPGTIAAQYLSRASGQGPNSLEMAIVTRSEFSPLVPAFEDSIRSVMAF
jgi:hypothetical protein